jgi:hypothetical protein
MSSTTLATPKAKPPLRQDEYVTFRAGRVEILLQCLRPGAAYRIDVYQGSLRIDDQCTSIDNETDARTIARGYAHLALQDATS